MITNRGMNYWESPDHRDRRLFLAVNNLLQAIDAQYREADHEFRPRGTTDLREGLGRDPKSSRWCNPPRPAGSSRTC